tara:strand:+ start:514 stop:771 length:258 start_codon:yes stop_codon:yes gene_type:complete
MAKKKAAQKPIIQPQDLPLIDRAELMDKFGSFRLNPFKAGKLTYRVVGTSRGEETEVWSYCIKCVETGEYKDKDHAWMLAAAKKK